MLKNFFIDHNGKLVKRTTFPIQVENLPGLINKVCKAKIQSIPTIEKTNLSGTLYRIQNTTKYFNSKDRLPERFKNPVSDIEEKSISDSQINLKYGVRLRTSNGEK